MLQIATVFCAFWVNSGLVLFLSFVRPTDCGAAYFDVLPAQICQRVLWVMILVFGLTD